MAVLTGRRRTPRHGSLAGWLLATLLPVIVMLVAITVESTHAFSSDNTSGWMRATFQALFGPVSDAAWAGVHHYIRKTGHFTGYGLLGLAWMRAWLLIWMLPLRTQPWKTWWRCSAAMATVCTMLVASLDELHQSFLADRTGVVTDVLLDTAGAVVMLLLCSAIARSNADGSRG